MLTVTKQVDRPGQQQWIIESDGITNTDTHAAINCDLNDVIPLATCSPLSPEFHSAKCRITEIDTSGAFVLVDFSSPPRQLGPVAVVTITY